jgi:hypothetical protein
VVLISSYGIIRLSGDSDIFSLFKDVPNREYNGNTNGSPM